MGYKKLDKRFLYHFNRHDIKEIYFQNLHGFSIQFNGQEIIKHSHRIGWCGAPGD